MQRYRLLFPSLLVAALLVSGCGLWVSQAKRQYALDRQLIATLVNDDNKQAFYLINAGADANTRWDAIPPPTLKALFNQLLRHSSSSENNSHTALIMACEMDENSTIGAAQERAFLNGNLTLVEAMWRHGGNLDARAEGNTTALDFAIGSGRRYTVEWLLSHGANPNVQNEEGYTALHTAIFSSEAERIVPLLLTHGANANQKNKAGETPFQLAQEAKLPNVMRLFHTSTK